jgi:FKBP-type peptidyl-prolyl cis-trans isomerase
MITPLRVILVAALLGIGTAVVISLQAPPLPPEEALTPQPGSAAAAADASAPDQPLGPPSPNQAPSTQPAFKLADGTTVKTASGLTIIQVKEGSGLAAKAGDVVDIHYIGRLYDTGMQFDNSYDRGKPLEITLTSAPGGGIPGFVEGVIGMRVGEKRQLIIPGDLAYGPRGVPQAKIPPNATLVFDVELMSIPGAK